MRVFDNNCVFRVSRLFDASTCIIAAQTLVFAFSKDGSAQKPIPADAQISSSAWIQREHYVALGAENTELQRLLNGSKAKGPFAAHLLVDGDALSRGEHANLKAIDWPQLQRDLALIIAMRLASGEKTLADSESNWICIHAYFLNDSPELNANIIRWTLAGFAAQEGRFGNVYVTNSYSNTNKGLWQRLEETALQPPTNVAAPVNENPIGNEYVQVYPVRTKLSRLYTGGADCVVLVQRKFADEFGSGLPLSIRTSMSVFSKKLGIETKNKVLFVFRYSPGTGEKAKEWFIEDGAQQMTQALGFKSSDTRLSFE